MTHPCWNTHLTGSQSRPSALNTLCKQDCGFYGTAELLGLCSKCYRILTNSEGLPHLGNSPETDEAMTSSGRRHGLMAQYGEESGHASASSDTASFVDGSLSVQRSNTFSRREDERISADHSSSSCALPHPDSIPELGPQVPPADDHLAARSPLFRPTGFGPSTLSEEASENITCYTPPLPSRTDSGIDGISPFTQKTEMERKASDLAECSSDGLLSLKPSYERYVLKKLSQWSDINRSDLADGNSLHVSYSASLFASSEIIPTPEGFHFGGSPSDVPSLPTTPDDLSHSERPSKGKRKPQKNIKRCFECNKKHGILGFTCRCGYIFCDKHRYSSTHDCGFDYKTVAKANLETQQVKLLPQKIARF